MNPLVSVVIPCFNSQNWIEYTLQSVFNQTYKNLEIIVVDDGSTDNLREKLDCYIRKGKIKYFFQNNKGPAAARNYGISKSNGKYIAFLDSDDMWLSEKIRKQVSFLENNLKYQLVFSNISIINEEGLLIYTHKNKIPKRKDNLIKFFFLGKIIMNTPTIMAERKLIEQMGCFNESLFQREDHYFLMNFCNLFKIYHIKEPLIKRRIREGSLTTENPARVLNINKLFYNMAINQFPELKKYSAHFWAIQYYSCAFKYYRMKQRKKAIVFALKAILRYPIFIRGYLLLFILMLPTNYIGIMKLKTFIKNFT